MATLDADQCVPLNHVINTLKTALSEEQVWALAHQSLLLIQNSEEIEFILNSENLFLKNDGNIHQKSLKKGVKKAVSRNQVLSSLGVVLFKALDFGLKEDEERSLSSDLELLIESLTSCEDLETKDEGIEDESLDDVIHKCVLRLSSRDAADNHYRAVVRALVTETVELNSFVAHVTREEEPFSDWARLWVQVIRQLRTGVHLRKVDREERVATEYALTPFEMLLDDIRRQRFKLKATTTTTTRDVKKDAHELILDFIRSRPPLIPVSQRQLKPLPTKQTTLYEKLMKSIREKDHKLRHVTQDTSLDDRLSPPTRQSLTPTPTRRLIKADLNLRLSTEDDDDDEEDDDSESQNRFSLKNLSLKLRRHSVSRLESPEVDVNEDTRQHVAQIWQSTEWGRALQCLSLTLHEVQHIRSVLTKAELETLAVTRQLREDLESGNICFTCLKTRFSFFGARPHTCKVCERAICERCVTRMHIPNETFEKVPIYMLSPSPSPPSSLSPKDDRTDDRRDDSPQMKRRSRLVGLMSRDAIVVDAGLRRSGPLVRVCRDCKHLVRHLCAQAL